MTAALLVSVGGLVLGAMLRISGLVTVPTMAEVLGVVPADPTTAQARTDQPSP